MIPRQPFHISVLYLNDAYLQFLMLSNRTPIVFKQFNIKNYYYYYYYYFFKYYILNL